MHIISSHGSCSSREGRTQCNHVLVLAREAGEGEDDDKLEDLKMLHQMRCAAGWLDIRSRVFVATLLFFSSSPLSLFLSA